HDDPFDYVITEIRGSRFESSTFRDTLTSSVALRKQTCGFPASAVRCMVHDGSIKKKRHVRH
ncbi:hypothetical protein SB783_41200, partial [Paraburkholderia sp. SIMBA_009]